MIFRVFLCIPQFKPFSISIQENKSTMISLLFSRKRNFFFKSTTWQIYLCPQEPLTSEGLNLAELTGFMSLTDLNHHPPHPTLCGFPSTSSLFQRTHHMHVAHPHLHWNRLTKPNHRTESHLYSKLRAGRQGQASLPVE